MDTATQPPAPPVVAPVAPPAPTLSYPTNERVRIGFPMRLVAGIIDAVLAAIPAAIVATVLSLIGLPRIGAVLGGLLTLAYYSLEVLKGRSVGKAMFGYAITAQDGSPAPQAALVKRYVYKQLPALISIVAAIPFLGLLNIVGWVVGLAIAIGALLVLKPERLTLHDKLFGTAVFGPPTVQFRIPSKADLLPSQAEIAAAKAAAQSAAANPTAGVTVPTSPAAQTPPPPPPVA